MIICNSNKFLEAHDAMPVPARMEGWFTLTALKDGIATRSVRFHNLITDHGLNGFGNTNSNQLYRYVHVGTGTAPPNAADTGLSAFLGAITGGAAVTQGFSPAPEFEFCFLRASWTSNVGQFGNNIITECGISGQTSNGGLFSRELIRDAAGEPVGFPILEDEQLGLTYELRLHIPATDFEAQIQVGSQTHDTLTRVIRAGNQNYWSIASPMTTGQNATVRSSGSGAFSGDLVARNGWEPATPRGVPSSVSNVGYTSGTYYRDGTFVWGPATGNGTVRTVVHCRGCAAFQTQYDPPISKTNTQSLILPQRFSWGRA